MIDQTKFIEKVAEACHEINRAYCLALGDKSQYSWSECPEWQKESIRGGVALHLSNPTTSPSDSHNSWLANKLAAGWKHGPVKDLAKMEHPCILPFEELPAEQKAKDFIFKAVVDALRQF